MRRFALLRNTLRTAWLFSTVAILGIPGVSANAQTQPAIFPIPTQISLPNGATPLFIGDFNGDGIPDLAYDTVPSGTSGTLGIILDYAGSAPTIVTTNVCPGAVFADVNNDKKLDAVSSSCNGYITVQLGNGDATFQAPAYYAINAANLLLVDLNGDGYLDIAAIGRLQWRWSDRCCRIAELGLQKRLWLGADSSRRHQWNLHPGRVRNQSERLCVVYHEWK
jgi:hypothetical protein